MQLKEIPFNLTDVNPISLYTEVKPSEIHGLGVFAKTKIPVKTVLWYARPQDVLVIGGNQFQSLENSLKSPKMEDFMKALLTYSYYERDSDSLIFCLDNARYINHSTQANSGSSEDENGVMSVALRDILPGEEITEDYSKYTPCDWLKKYESFFNPRFW